jgi:hypothetical protein
MGLLAAWLFTLMCFNRVAWGIIMDPTGLQHCNIDFLSMARGLEQLIDIELSLSQMLQLSKALVLAPSFFCNEGVCLRTTFQDHCQSVNTVLIILYPVLISLLFPVNTGAISLNMVIGN